MAKVIVIIGNEEFEVEEKIFNAIQEQTRTDFDRSYAKDRKKLVTFMKGLVESHLENKINEINAQNNVPMTLRESSLFTLRQAKLMIDELE